MSVGIGVLILFSSWGIVRESVDILMQGTPREMRQRLRIQQAKNLLLETSLSIKEISIRLGYPRQHEFTRDFHQHLGLAPTAWRADPIRSTVVL